MVAIGGVECMIEKGQSRVRSSLGEASE